MSSRDQIQLLSKQMQQSIIGQENVIERLILALLANGNVLMEGLPGLAKTPINPLRLNRGIQLRLSCW